MLNANMGMEYLNYTDKNKEEKEFTVIVSGLGRSGTTMVAKMLSGAGLAMGVAKANTIHEDVVLAGAIEKHNTDVVRRIAKERNELHPRWGFKRPLIVKHESVIEAHLRNPRYILIFRDPMAVAMRNNLSLGFKIHEGLTLYIKQTNLLVSFLRGTKRPVLLASYEKVLQNPEAFAEAVADFAGLPRTEVPAMVAVVNPNDEAYRKATQKR